MTNTMEALPVNFFQPLVNTSLVIFMLAWKYSNLVSILIFHQADVAPEQGHFKTSAYSSSITHDISECSLNQDENND